MIFGIGTDICEIPRIAATLSRRGDRFAQKVLGPDEWKVFNARRARLEARGLAYLATRFSAKESFSKAIGLGLRLPMLMRHCEILNHRSGQPFIRLHGELAAWCQARSLTAHVTLSDELERVVSFVVVEQAIDARALAAQAAQPAIASGPPPPAGPAHRTDSAL